MGGRRLTNCGSFCMSCGGSVHTELLTQFVDNLFWSSRSVRQDSLFWKSLQSLCPLHLAFLLSPRSNHDFDNLTPSWLCSWWWWPGAFGPDQCFANQSSAILCCHSVAGPGHCSISMTAKSWCLKRQKTSSQEGIKDRDKPGDATVPAEKARKFGGEVKCQGLNHWCGFEWLIATEKSCPSTPVSIVKESTHQPIPGTAAGCVFSPWDS